MYLSVAKTDFTKPLPIIARGALPRNETAATTMPIH